jgi:hypothetical protein
MLIQHVLKAHGQGRYSGEHRLAVGSLLGALILDDRTGLLGS